MFFYLILFRINSIDGIDCNMATKRKLKFVCNLVSSFFKVSKLGSKLCPLIIKFPNFNDSRRKLSE